MKTFTAGQEKLLLALAVFGLVVPNGAFLYFAWVAPEMISAALANPIALVFIAEAFLLLLLFAWLIHRWGLRSPGWLAFLVLSLVGSLAFSVPFFLYRTSRASRGLSS